MSTDLGKNVQSLSVGDAIDEVTCVVVQYGVDSSGNPLTKTATASPNDGRTINISVDHISETMAQTVADNILSQYTDIVYNSLTASGAELDPACELFDQVTVDDIDTAIGSVDTTFNKGMFANIEAQGLADDDDFPFTSLIERQVQRADTKADTAISGLSEKADTSSLAAGTTTISGACITTGTMQADRIKGGSLTLGGDDNENGELFIKNADDETIGTWNNSGVEIEDDTASATVGYPTFRIRKTGNTTGGAYMGIWNPSSLGDDPAFGYIRLDGTYDDVTRNSQMIILPYSISMEQTVNSDTHSLTIKPYTETGVSLSGTVYNSGTLQYYSTCWGKMNQITLILTWTANFTMPADTNIFAGTITDHIPYWGTVYATAHQVDDTFKAWIDTNGNVVIRNSTAKTVYGTTTSGADWHYLTVTFNYLEE